MADYIPDNGCGGLSKYQLEDWRHMPLFLINGDIPPDNVRYGYTEDTEQLVRSQRNSQGVVVSQKIGVKEDGYSGQRLMKFNNLEWPMMDMYDYNWLQAQVEKFYCYVTYWDARAGFDENEKHTTGGFVTKKFYFGDFSAEPWHFIRDTRYGILIPDMYINIKVNLIDCGEPYLSPSDPHFVNIPAYQPPYEGER